MVTETIKAQCCIAGGGPAGIMLGLLLARAGVDVAVLEKHADFFRDFRGDTVHPSTLEVMYELGLLEAFLKRPHQKMPQLRGKIGELELMVADFSHLKVHAPYIAFMPQWDFLDFLADEARRYPGFHLHMNTEARDVIEEGGRVVGVKCDNLEVRADLVVAADGRHSTLRERAGLEIEDFGAPIDVFWFRLSRKESDPPSTLGRFLPGRIIALINRQEYWQCGYVIPKGEAERIKQRGLEAFRATIVEAVPIFEDRVQELDDWEKIKLLTVKVDRLREWWKPGLLVIGDAAHAMSPVGGVGINLAVQDAVAAANILSKPLREGKLTDSHLAAVQARREFPVRMTQKMQILVQNRVISSVLAARGQFKIPGILRVIQRFPAFARLPGYLIGMGFRPEHINNGVIPAKAGIHTPQR